MYSTTAYLYQQKTKVLLIDTSGDYFTMRYNPVYAKRLTINLGVDNVILFEFINQDEKPVNITGSSLVFRLIAQDGAELLREVDMQIISAVYGRAKVTLTAEDLVGIEAQPASYSITRTSGNLTEPVFTNAAAGARAPVDIVDSVYPEFIPSTELTIPTTNLGAQTVGIGGTTSLQYPDWSLQYGSPAVNTYAPIQSTEFYSSFIEPAGPVTTIQMDLLGYTGDIKVQAAENYQSQWYNVSESRSYLNATETIHFTIIGWHPLLRLGFNNNVATTGLNGSMMGYTAQAIPEIANGVITGIQVVNPGLGYLAPPLIEIVGDGAGATAVATLGSQGTISYITVTSGGSGYRPNPPTNVGATILISTGRVENIIYR